jgi:hypothetical protein
VQEGEGGRGESSGAVCDSAPTPLDSPRAEGCAAARCSCYMTCLAWSNGPGRPGLIFMPAANSAKLQNAIDMLNPKFQMNHHNDHITLAFVVIITY